MRLANTEWFKLINYRNFSLYFTTAAQLPQIVDRLLQYDGPIGVKFEKSKIRTLEYMEQISRLTNLTSLDVLPNDFRLNLHMGLKMTALTNLQEWNLPYDCPTPILAALTNMKELHIRSNADQLTESIKKMSNLHNILFSTPDDCPVDIFSLLPCPSRLTKLEIKSNMNVDHMTKLYNLQNLLYTDSLSENKPIQVSLALDKFTALHTLQLDQQCGSVSALPSTLTSLSISGDTPLDARTARQIARLCDLKMLSLCGANSSDALPFVSLLTSLEEFVVWPRREDNPTEHRTGAFFSDLTSSKLVTMSLSVTPHMRLDHLSRLTGLVDLFCYEELSETDVVDYSFVSHLTQLTSFMIYVTGARPSLTAIMGLENMKQMTIDGANVTSFELPDISFARLTGLERLSLGDCGPSTVESFSALKNLTLLCAPVAYKNVDYEFLKDMPYLEYLWCLSSTAGCDNYYRVLPHLTSLNSLQLRGLEDEDIIAQMTALQHLTNLSLQGSIQGLHLTRLTSLQRLVVRSPRSSAYWRHDALMKKMPYLIHFSQQH